MTGAFGASKTYGLYVNASGSDDANYAAIFASGNLGIGTTVPNAPLQVSGNVNASSFNGLNFFYKAGNNGSVSCDNYCTNTGANWGTAGTCVSAKRGDNGAFVACSTTTGNITNGMNCYCSNF